ncbi:hypothetical protein [Ruminococcus sp.]|uniref:hypothetical protein n=1 Tax=Ruminococcus sp. TaxID=41978 RepID=UPI003AB5AF06
MGCWKCWKCWECWKIYDFSTLSMFSMLSMLQKEGNAAQESPFIANAVRNKHSAGSAQVPQGRNRHSAGGAHKLRRTARATAQESRNEGGRLSEVATLAVIVLEAYY